MAITLPNTITPGTLASATEVQENFDELADLAVNSTGDTLTGTLNTRSLIPTVHNTYDLGTTSLRYKDIYVAGSIVGLTAGNTFTTVAVSGQSDVVADTSSDTLTLAAGTGITLTTNASTDTVTITANPTTNLAGGSVIPFAPAGNVYQSTTATGNVGAGEDTLYSKSLAASLLANDGERLTFRATGVFAGNAAAKRIKVKYGATTILDTGATAAANDAGWVLTGTITRTSATTQRCEAVLNTGTFLVGVDTLVNAATVAAGETLSGAVTFAITGEATTTNDIILHAIAIDWHGRATN